MASMIFSIFNSTPDHYKNLSLNAIGYTGSLSQDAMDLKISRIILT